MAIAAINPTSLGSVTSTGASVSRRSFSSALIAVSIYPSPRRAVCCCCRFCCARRVLQRLTSVPSSLPSNPFRRQYQQRRPPHSSSVLRRCVAHPRPPPSPCRNPQTPDPIAAFHGSRPNTHDEFPRLINVRHTTRHTICVFPSDHQSNHYPTLTLVVWSTCRHFVDRCISHLIQSRLVSLHLVSSRRITTRTLPLVTTVSFSRVRPDSIRGNTTVFPRLFAPSTAQYHPAIYVPCIAHRPSLLQITSFSTVHIPPPVLCVLDLSPVFTDRHPVRRYST